MSYDSEKDSWHGPMSQYIKLDILKEAKGRINLYEEHKRCGEISLTYHLMTVIVLLLYQVSAVFQTSLA